MATSVHALTALLKLIQNNLFFVFQREKIAAADFGINESRKLQHYSILYTLD